MTRTLRERLATRDAGPAVGTLVRCVNPDSYFLGMSGTVVVHDRFVPSVVSVKMTSTGHVVSFNANELTPVAGSAA